MPETRKFPGNTPSTKTKRQRSTVAWQEAFKIGICPYKGCDITKKTCACLDKYLSWGQQDRDVKQGKTKTILQQHLENIPERIPSHSNTQGVWALFKFLRRLDLAPIQILILIRVGLGFSRQQTMRELKLHSVSQYQRHYDSAIRLLQAMKLLKDVQKNVKS